MIIKGNKGTANNFLSSHLYTYRDVSNYHSLHLFHIRCCVLFFFFKAKRSITLRERVQQQQQQRRSLRKKERERIIVEL
jgi:hypothetical protein